MCGVWCVVCGVWCVVCGVWCVVCGGMEQSQHPMGTRAPSKAYGVRGGGELSNGGAKWERKQCVRNACEMVQNRAESCRISMKEDTCLGRSSSFAKVLENFRWNRIDTRAQSGNALAYLVPVLVTAMKITRRGDGKTKKAGE